MTRERRARGERVREVDDDGALVRAPAEPEPDFVDTRRSVVHGSAAWGDAPRRDLEAVETVLDTVLGRFAGPRRSALQQVVAVWATAAGEAWKDARPVRIDGETLVVEVPDGITASRLQFDSVRLITALGGVAGGALRSLRFRVARS